MKMLPIFNYLKYKFIPYNNEPIGQFIEGIAKDDDFINKIPDKVNIIELLEFMENNGIVVCNDDTFSANITFDFIKRFSQYPSIYIIQIVLEDQVCDLPYFCPESELLKIHDYPIFKGETFKVYGRFELQKMQINVSQKTKINKEQEIFGYLKEDWTEIYEKLASVSKYDHKNMVITPQKKLMQNVLENGINCLAHIIRIMNKTENSMSSDMDVDVTNSLSDTVYSMIMLLEKSYKTLEAVEHHRRTMCNRFEEFDDTTDSK